MLKVEPVLYSSWRSSCSYRVRICLNLKNIKYELKPVDSSKLAMAAGVETYTQNPMNYIPALDIDEITLIESIAIMEYLEETRPEIALMPKDPQKRAQVRAICGIIVAGIQPLQNTSVLNKIRHLSENIEEEEKWSQHWIKKGFAAIEKILETSAGKYCVGDQITFADCCLVPQVFNARRFHLDLEAYPTIFKIDRQLQSHQAFKQAHPMLQMDFPGEKIEDPSTFPFELFEPGKKD